MTSSPSSRITEPSLPRPRGWGAALCAPARCRAGTPHGRGFLKGLRWDRGAEPPQKHKAVHSVETLLLPIFKGKCVTAGLPVPSYQCANAAAPYTARVWCGVWSSAPTSPAPSCPVCPRRLLKDPSAGSRVSPHLLSYRCGAGPATPLRARRRDLGWREDPALSPGRGGRVCPE